MSTLVREEAERATAMHEAGHVVTAYRFHHSVGTVTIVPRDEAAGSAATEAEWMDGSTDLEQVVVLFAGFAAQRMDDPLADPAPSRQDKEKAAHLLFVQGREEAASQTEARLMEMLASAIVRESRAQVEAVATALQANRTLTGDEATIIIDAVDEGLDWHPALQKYRVLRDSR